MLNINTFYHGVFFTLILCVNYTLPTEQKIDTNDTVRTQLSELFEKSKSFEPSFLHNQYKVLVERRNAFFGSQLGSFNRANSISNIPTNLANRPSLKNLSEKDIEIQIAQDALATHAIVKKEVIDLINSFIMFKSNNSKHKDLYKTFVGSPLNYINRLLTKRPISFLNATDNTRLSMQDNVSEDDPSNYNYIEEKMSYTSFYQYISYDEMVISALLGLCSPTFVINKGHRTNRAVLSADNTFVPRALYCGLVGARFEKPGAMEWKHIIIDEGFCNAEYGYGDTHSINQYINANQDKKETVLNRHNLLKIWADFYNIRYFPTFDEIAKQDNDTSTQYIKLFDSRNKVAYFNADVYKKRLRSSIEPFLYNADAYGAMERKNVYAHVVGLGTGVWGAIGSFEPVLQYYKDYYGSTKKMISILQVTAYAEYLNEKIDTLNNITDIDFSYWSTLKLDTMIDIFKKQPNLKVVANSSHSALFIKIKMFIQSMTHVFDVYLDRLARYFLSDRSIMLNNKIKIILSERDPFEPLAQADVQKLIVAMYAWDSNAFPGNEYYFGMLDATGDPAAACSSTIGDLGNPFINPDGLNNIMIY